MEKRFAIIWSYITFAQYFVQCKTCMTPSTDCGLSRGCFFQFKINQLFSSRWNIRDFFQSKKLVWFFFCGRVSIYFLWIKKSLEWTRLDNFPLLNPAGKKSMKNKGWLNIEKNISKCGKTFCNNLVIHYFCAVLCPL